MRDEKCQGGGAVAHQVLSCKFGSKDNSVSRPDPSSSEDTNRSCGWWQLIGDYHFSDRVNVQPFVLYVEDVLYIEEESNNDAKLQDLEKF